MRMLLVALALCAASADAAADDPLLDETVFFTGQIFHLDNDLPGLVIAAVRGEESAVFGFGETAKGSGRTPDGETQIAIASITKTFTGLSLAALVADGTVELTDEAGPHVGLVDELPHAGGRRIRFVDLVTHSSGLPRELSAVSGVRKYTDESFRTNLDGTPLLFAPGTGILYSNIGFDVLALALSGAAGKPYETLLHERVLEPLDLRETGYARPTGENVMVGHDFDGSPIDPGDPIANRQGASQLYTDANDMVAYMR